MGLPILSGVFGINGSEFLVIILVAVIVVGPQRLPEYTRKLTQMVRQLRVFLDNARSQIAEEVGPEMADLDLSSLDPRQYDPRKIVRDALGEDIDAIREDLAHPFRSVGSAAKEMSDDAAQAVNDVVKKDRATSLSKQIEAKRDERLAEKDAEKAENTESTEVAENAEGPQSAEQPPATAPRGVLQQADDVEHAVEAEAEADAPRRSRFAWLLPVISLMLAIGVVIAGWLGWQWSQSQYYVMGKDGSVVIFQGIPQSIGSWNLSHAVEITDVKLDQLAAVDQQRLQEPVTRSSRGEVDAYVAILRSNARERALQQAREAQQTQPSEQNSDQQNQSQPTPTPEATQEGGN